MYDRSGMVESNPEPVIPIVLEPGAKMPTYATAQSAGMDLCALASVRLEPFERRLINTGVRMAIPEGFEGQVRPRSGLALKRGLGMVNSPGTIDSDYRGEIGLILINFGQEPIELDAGERLAQLVICPVVRAHCLEVTSLEATDRGDGGFGSTGTHSKPH
jgi:dUTP pyrophosphatase